jgi:UDP-N-acetylglucosamine transferase subunit ALG13
VPAVTGRVVVTVGTDHHQFDRLIGWLNDWLGQHPEQAGDFFIQSGSASVAPACPAADFLDPASLGDLLERADVVICHGGPGSISDAWARGHLPIVVPRLRRHDEVVDDHQVDFCRKLAELGRVRLAQTPAELAALLDQAAAGALRRTPEQAAAPETAAAIARFGELIDQLVSRPRRRLYRPGRAARIRRAPVGQAAPGATAAGLPPGGFPDQFRDWRASGTPARVGLAGVPEKEHE